jgi:flagellar basal body-associated protein FliL
MKKEKAIILIIIFALILLILGLGLGYSLSQKQTKKTIKAKEAEYKTLEAKLKPLEPFSKLLESEVAQSLCANLSGKVVEISDQTITITKGDNSLKLEIEKDARFFSQKIRGEIAQPLEEIKLENIKIGDEVSIYARLDKAGGLKALHITVFHFE